MPPAYLGHEPLSPAQIDIVRRWIEEGARYEAHWSLVPPQRPALPERNNSWAKNPIDNFVLAKLTKEGLRPSPEAARETLLRRLTFDLTGLPPTPQEAAAYLNDRSANAYEKVVDRLLASPRYGERMAVRWLEAARYADSNGYQSDGPRDMYRWRDWVINAFQKNMRFDQFTIEQIAGDLLPKPTLDQRIATAFNRNHSTSAEGGIVDEEFRVQYVADRVETTSTVWMGMTVGCARCHDHKYDPIKQKDFYQLFAFFNNVPERGFVYNFGNEEPYIKAPLPDQQAKLDVFDRDLAAASRKVEDFEPALIRAQRQWERSVSKQEQDWTITAGRTFRSTPEQAGRFDGKREVDAGKDVPHINYRDPFTFAAWIKPETGKGAIMSRGEDYFEGAGHFLHLVDGKIRLHATFRWSDLAMRLETVKPVELNKWQHVTVTYDGSMHASHVRIYVNGEPQEIKILFDQPIWPMDKKAATANRRGRRLALPGRDRRCADLRYGTDAARSCCASVAKYCRPNRSTASR